MDPGPLRDVLTVGMGVLSGVMSAAFGIGGASLSTPGIRLLGASAYVAVGTTLPSILPSAFSGAARYTREGLVRWWAVATAAPVGVAAAVAGSLLSHAVPGNGHWLMILTAALLGLTAFRMARHPEPPPLIQAEADAALARPARLRDRRGARATTAAAGAASGLLSGLLGVGGGVVLVPAFTELIGMPTKSAIATSLACVGIFAVPGTLAHAALGDIDWRFALLLAVGVVPGARLGATAVLRSTDRRVRRAAAGFFGAIAVGYAISELLALAR